jgi:hypothetical protein
MIPVRKDEGSMVMEAALVMPFFLAFVLALISLIQISVTDMALRSTVSESTKQLAVHMYAGSLLMNKFSDTKVGQDVNEVIQKINDAKNQINEKEELVDNIAKVIPDNLIKPLLTLRSLEQEQRAYVELNTDNAVQSVLKAAFAPYVRQFADSSYLNASRIVVRRVQVPIETDGKSFLGIELSYKLKLQIPFFKKEIELQKKAYERAWFGDQGANQVKTTHKVKIVSISPNPVFRGSRIRLRAIVPPNSSASITVKYKSGISIAQGLDSHKADADGNVSWEWKVGGSTTAIKESGLAIVEVEGSRDGISFDVIRRN